MKNAHLDAAEMNPFAKLLSAENQVSVLLDCCTIIGAKNGNPGSLEFRKKITSRRDIRIIVPDIAVREVSKVADIPQDGAFELIESFSELGQIVYVKTTKEIENQAQILIEKYPQYCHAPDNIYVIHSKVAKAILVTYDKQLQRVALSEGIICCKPMNFLIS